MKLSEEVRYWAYRLCVTENSNDEKAEVLVAWSEKIAELEQELERFIKVFDQEMVIDHIGVFNSGDDPEEALRKIIIWNMEISAYFANERIAELKQELAQCLDVHAKLNDEKENLIKARDYDQHMFKDRIAELEQKLKTAKAEQREADAVWLESKNYELTGTDLAKTLRAQEIE